MVTRSRSPSREHLLARFVEKAREDGYRPTTIQMYLRWIARFHSHCSRRGLPDESGELTRRNVERFTRRYVVGKRRLKARPAVKAASAALRRWARTLADGHIEVPAWEQTPQGPFDDLLSRYRLFRRRWRGVRESSLTQDAVRITRFLHWLGCHRQSLATLAPATIDRYLVDRSRNSAPATIAAVATSLRSFLRFLHADGLLPIDLSLCVARAPTRRFVQPGRVQPWADVRRLLRVIDRGTEMGKRDYAAILLMPTYGMGAGEVLGLRLDDIDWSAGSIRVVRAKTGVATTIPLLGPVGRAIASYLRASAGRRGHTRALFLKCRAPNGPIFFTGLRLRLLHYARAAGVAFLGTHAFRRTHACRQIEGGAPSKVVSDILGHKDPRSISTYARIATGRLREVSLPLPR